MSLNQLSQLYLPAIEDELRRALSGGDAAYDLYYRMLNYHMGWVDADGTAIAAGAGGKRLRPLITLLTCAAVGGAWERALPLAAGLELLHNFSLLHDDIQDNSPLRRGRPTAWTLWGAAQAINAGDALFTLAHLAVQSLAEHGVPAATALRVLTAFDRTCLALTQGQFLDMQFETRAQVGVAEYLAMIEGKTAALVAACTELGGRVAGVDEARGEHLRLFGRSLGLAFQIQDDLLGIWGDPAVTGKSAASDLEKRKKSLPVVIGLERSPEFAAAYARPAAADGPALSALVGQLEALGAHAEAQALAEAHTREARAHLEAARPAGAAAEALRALADQLLNRSA